MYVVQAGFATIIIFTHVCLSLSVKFCCWACTHSKWLPRLARFVAQCRTVLDKFVKVFWITSLYFALAIIIASNLATEPYYPYMDSDSPAGMTLTSPSYPLIGMHFATTVLICLWPWYGRQAKFPNAALFCVTLLWLFNPFLTGLFYFPQHAPSNPFTCYNLEPSWYISWALSYDSQYIFPLGLVYHIIYRVVRRYRYVIGKNCGWLTTV